MVDALPANWRLRAADMDAGGPLPEGVRLHPPKHDPGPPPAAGPVPFFGFGAEARAKAVTGILSGMPMPSVFEIDGGLTFGRGLVATPQCTLLAGHAITQPAEALISPVWGGLLRRDGTDFRLDDNGLETLRIDSPAVLGILPGYRIYGHILVDWIPRVMMALERAPHDAVILVPKQLPAYARRFLSMLGVDTGRLLDVDDRHQIVQAQSLFVAGQVRRASVWWHGAQVYLRPLLAQDSGRTDMPRRVWVSRSALANQRRRLINRDLVAERLGRLGLVAVSPEELPFPHQVALFSRAELVVGEAGSGMHNTLFGPTDQHVGVLQADTLGSLLQASLCASLGQPIAFALGQSLSLTRFCDYADYIVDPATLMAFERHLLSGHPPTGAM